MPNVSDYRADTPRMNFSRLRRVVLASSLVATSLTLSIVPGTPSAQAAGTPDVALSKDMPTEALYGAPIPVTLTATNPGGPDGYNLSFSDTLPVGATVAGSTPAPTSTVTLPDGRTRVVWQNVADLLTGTSVTVSYEVSIDPSEFSIGDDVVNSANAYVNSNPRLLPAFDGTGTVVPGSFTGNDAASDQTELTPFEVTKRSPNTEDELLRGVHDHQTVYTIRVENNPVVGSTGFSVVDYLSAGLEFLGCGTTDNTTVGEEYPGSGPINPGNAPTMANPCPTPTSVTTVTTDPDGAGVLPNAVYTRVEWNSAALSAALGSSSLAAGADFEIDYIAAIPLRQNVQATLTDPTANLDNNTGAVTSDEQSLVNLAVAQGTTAGTGYTDRGSYQVSAEDVSIHKSVDIENVTQSTPSIWTLFVESSEYALSTGAITVTDTLPSSLDLVTATPTASPSGGVVQPDGTLLLTWNLPGFTSPSETATITIDTVVRTAYRGAGPVAANDGWTNTTSLTTDATIITDNTGATSTSTIPDESSASQEAGGPTILKEVSDPVGGVLTCGDGTSMTFSDGLAAGTYRPGDRVCWRLTVDYPINLDYLDAIVRDFLPAGFTYESHQATPANTIVLAPTAFTDASPVLTWDLGDVANAGERFQVVISTVISDPTTQASGDILSNLMKVRYANTGSGVFQLRDLADADYVEPELTLTKSANPTTVNGGDVVDYTVTVPNTGGLAASAVSVRDVLPTGIACADIVPASLGAGVCDVANGWIQWDGLSIAAGATQNLTYQLLVPGTFAPGTALVNTAGVRGYNGATNTGTPFTLVPSGNIDPTLTPNTGPASASATINVANPTLAKTRTTSITEAGNVALDQATIGETVTYTVTAVIPEGTTTPNLVLSDPLGTQQTLSGTPTFTLNGGALPGGFVTSTAGNSVTVTLPTSYVNAASSGDDTLVVSFDVTIDDEAANVRPSSVGNTVGLTWTGGSLSANTSTQIVEPNLTVAKTHDDTDGQVVPGQEPVIFTVRVSNPTGTNVSTAHDIVVTDIVPADIIPIDSAGDPAADGATLPGGGLWDLDTRTITWTIASIAPGGSSALTYPTEIASFLAGASSLTNTVTGTASSIAGSTAGERTAATAAAAGAAGYEDDASVTLTGPQMTTAKSATPSHVTIGETVTYTVDVVIPERVLGYDTTVLDTLPAGMVFEGVVSATCTACAPAVTITPLSAPGSTGTIGFFLGDLVPGSASDRTVTIIYTAYADTTVGDGDALVNSAVTHFNQVDRIVGVPSSVPSAGSFDRSTAAATAQVDVVEPALTVDKDVVGQVGDTDLRRAKPGDVLEFSLTVTNTGTSDAFDVTVTDTPDARLTGFTDTGAGIVVDSDPTDGTLSWAIAGPIAPGDSVIITYELTVPASIVVADEVAGFELDNTADVPSYFGMSAADRLAEPTRDYVEYDNVTADLVQIELDLASIGDHLWYDIDDDGAVDVGEPALADVTVTVTYLGVDGAVGGGDDETFVTSTDAAGNYLVDLLPGGQYLVTVDTADPDLSSLGLSPSFDLDGGLTSPNGQWAGALSENAIKRDVDFGFTGTGSIGDTVWVDQDVNGALNGVEPGVPGVVVELTWFGPGGVLGGGDDVVYTDTTDALGQYLFPNLPAGSFDLAVDTSTIDASYDNVFDPDGTEDAQTSVSLSIGEAVTDQDFGFAGTGSIGDAVFLDQNGDGTQGPSEPGLSGVTVELTFIGANGETATFSAVTDGSGQYLFENLPAGSFTVVVVGGVPEGVDNSADPDGGADSTADLVLADGGERLDLDFGYDADSLLGDRVWWDLDRDGIQDAGEPGIPGVVVTVIGPNGLTFTATTAADGSYLFQDLPSGDFDVTITSGLPGGFTATADADGGNDSTSTLTLTTQDLDQDFGYAGSSSLGDFVWLDRDGDGIQDPAEPGLSGVDVTLIWAGPDGDLATADNVTFITTTDIDGGYGFIGLPAGEYRVVVDVADLPSGLDASFDLDDGTVAPDHTWVGTLGASETKSDVDFGYLGGASIGDFVWFDRDGDGFQDAGEPGIGSVDVSLTWAGPDGVFANADDEVFATTTGADGLYTFDGLSAGLFLVDIDDSTLPAGMGNTFDRDGDLNGSSPVTLTDNAVVRDVDFGYRGDGAIGDTIYLDLDGDGAQDPGEPGVPAQPVSLIWAGVDGALGTADDESFTTVTAANGTYLFGGLPDGDYRVVVSGGIAVAAENTGDPDGGTADQADLTLTGGASDLDQDFGYQGLNRLGDTIWWDVNGDGIDDGIAGARPEPRLAGVDVVVTWFGPDGVAGGIDDIVIPTQPTDADGLYSADGLPDGTYSVDVVSGIPSGLTSSVDPDSGPPAPDGTTTADGYTEVSLVSGGVAYEDLDQDFGFTSTGRIGDTVWLDLDGDGTVDAGEPGLEGVTVTLTWAGSDGDLSTVGDNLVFVTQVADDGSYLFDRLPAGEFSIVLTDLPVGVNPTSDPDGADDSASLVTLAAGEAELGQNFGYNGSSGVGDLLWLDVDGDGTKDANEPGLPGIDLTVASPGSDGVPGTADDLMVVVTTDANGNYLVEGLPPGNTTVSYDPADLPSGVAPSTDLDGGTLSSTSVVLDPDTTELDVDFGANGNATLDGIVYFDLDNDGVLDAGETGIPGVTVVVVWTSPSGPVEIPVMAGADGRWALPNVPAGTYTSSVRQSTVPVGHGGSTPAAVTVVVPDGGTATTQHGFAPTGSISGRVWDDKDRDGVQDSGEAGVGGVRVELLDAAGTVVSTTTTNASGDYRFDHLLPGTYGVRVVESTLPVGVIFVSDPDATVNGATPLTLSAGQQMTNVAFGIARPRTSAITIGSLAFTGGGLAVQLLVAAMLIGGGWFLLGSNRRSARSSSTGSGGPESPQDAPD